MWSLFWFDGLPDCCLVVARVICVLYVITVFDFLAVLQLFWVVIWLSGLQLFVSGLFGLLFVWWLFGVI